MPSFDSQREWTFGSANYFLHRRNAYVRAHSFVDASSPQEMRLNVSAEMPQQPADTDSAAVVVHVNSTWREHGPTFSWGAESQMLLPQRDVGDGDIGIRVALHLDGDVDTTSYVFVCVCVCVCVRACVRVISYMRTCARACPVLT